MSASSNSESGGQKGKSSSYEDDDFYGDNYENKYDQNDDRNDPDDNNTPTTDSANFMDRIEKNVTASHQIKLMFQDYDEKKPKATETVCVIANLLNFLAAIAGDRIRTGSTSDLKELYVRADEFCMEAYEHFPWKSEAQTKNLLGVFHPTSEQSFTPNKKIPPDFEKQP